jgi:hypothetical protein
VLKTLNETLKSDEHQVRKVFQVFQRLLESRLMNLFAIKKPTQSDTRSSLDEEDAEPKLHLSVILAEDIGKARLNFLSKKQMKTFFVHRL